MGDKIISSVHWSFWLVAAAALIWNVMGGINFIVQMNSEALSSYPESYRAIIEGRPIWATAGFALAVFGGALAGLLLLLRKSIAYYLFIASLVGAIVVIIHTLGVLDSDFKPIEPVIGNLSQLVVTAFLIGYSRWARGKAWIRQG